MNKKNVALHIISPFLLILVCVGILSVAMIKPADKLKVFVNVAFMDSLKSDPTTTDSGLVIRDNDIISDYDGETSDEGEIIRPSFGELFATLYSEKMGIEIPVYWGSNSELLERGACQTSGSAIIGDSGNSVISAHVDTFFADLNKLEVGDIVTIKTNYGSFEFAVDRLIEFDSTDRRYVTPKKDNRLTLYTCKKDLFGSTDRRIGVVCTPTESVFYKEAKK